MSNEQSVYMLILATLIGYMLGSVPVAVLISRIRSVNILSTGTQLAGAANVYRNVGAVEGLAVFAGDTAKGALTIIAAHQLRIEGATMLLPAFAALSGHWWPVFARFRGGDGLSTVVGITFALLTIYSLPSMLTGGIVAAIARGTGHHASLWGGSAGYGLLLLRSPMSQENNVMVIGVVVLAIMVLIHAVRGHRRRRSTST